MIIGITGGIASGKSMASRYLQNQGYPVIDTDLIARDVMLPESDVLRKCVEVFGKKILKPDGQLNREVLGQIIFSDENARKTLNEITHPVIYRQAQEALKDQKGRLVFLVVPLMFEAGFDALCDEVWNISADLEVKCARLMQRDHISRMMAIKKIQTQLDEHERCRLADKVLFNNEGEQILYEQIDQALQELQKNKNFS